MLTGSRGSCKWWGRDNPGQPIGVLLSGQTTDVLIVWFIFRVLLPFGGIYTRMVREMTRHDMPGALYYRGPNGVSIYLS